MIENPLRELAFGLALFSLIIVSLSSSKTDASHPYKKKETNLSFPTQEPKALIES